MSTKLLRPNQDYPLTGFRAARGVTVRLRGGLRVKGGGQGLGFKSGDRPGIHGPRSPQQHVVDDPPGGQVVQPLEGLQNQLYKSSEG